MYSSMTITIHRHIHLGTLLGSELCFEADLSILDWVATVTLSFKLAFTTVFLSLTPVTCSP